MDSDPSDQSYNLFAIKSQAATLNLTVNQKSMTMELYTGASYSLISEQVYKTTWAEAEALAWNN